MRRVPASGTSKSLHALHTHILVACRLSPRGRRSPLWRLVANAHQAAHDLHEVMEFMEHALDYGRHHDDQLTTDQKIILGVLSSFLSMAVGGFSIRFFDT
jgi:hypothetical protein